MNTPLRGSVIHGAPERKRNLLGVRLDRHLPGFLDHPEDVNKKLKLLFLSCGTEDPRFPGQLDLADLLKQHKIKYSWYPTPGVHEWKVWRHALHEFAQKVFQAGS